MKYGFVTSLVPKKVSISLYNWALIPLWCLQRVLANDELDFSIFITTMHFSSIKNNRHVVDCTQSINSSCIELHLHAQHFVRAKYQHNMQALVFG